MNIVIGGIQGCGKGTQSKLLASKYGLRHISVGDCIFKYLNEEPDFVLPYTLEKYRNGDLAPSDVVNRVVDRELTESVNGFVLDGYPRQKAQLEYLMNHTVKVDAFILLDMSEDTAVARLMFRGRADDTVDGIRNRIGQYMQFTKPVLDELEKLVPTYVVDATQSIQEVSAIIESVINFEKGR